MALSGDESEVVAQLRFLADVGATDFLASIFPAGEDEVASLIRTAACYRAWSGRLDDLTSGETDHGYTTVNGKVALISEVARGQEATEARMLALEGAEVVFGDILDDEGKKVEAQFRKLGGEAT